ncbi:MAG: DUF2914 domain-containing protein [Balneolaceae bacterium]|nr:DUF2914 domain-containing protein [Balneolaceae bacterium]
MKKSIITTALLFVFVLSVQSQNLTVDIIQFGTDVENRKIVNADSVFTNSIERIYCFTEIDGAEQSTTITHVWYYGDLEKARVELPVNGPNWRTWSSKFILENWTGPWSVEVLDSNGNVLATKTFRVQDAVADQ